MTALVRDPNLPDALGARDPASPQFSLKILIDWLSREARDARFWQILSLGALLVFNLTQLSLGAALRPSLVALGAAGLTQIIASRIAKLPRLDLRSALISGLSLALLLRGDSLWVPALAGILAILSKFTLRMAQKPIFNPTAFAIVVLLTTGHAWVTPGQWGQSVILASLMVWLGILVLTRAGRLDIALAFFAAHAALLTARALWLGDPLAIPLHQLENGALVLFACFMITDPRTTPNARTARLAFALMVALLAYLLAFDAQLRPALYVALVALSPLVPLIDRFWHGPRAIWHRSKESSYAG
jgi:Na+-translocating ferredoxin:NAD+ oxidoreductase RnfD subunit